jgi:hypothetical protein
VAPIRVAHRERAIDGFGALREARKMVARIETARAAFLNQEIFLFHLATEPADLTVNEDR